VRTKQETAHLLLINNFILSMSSHDVFKPARILLVMKRFAFIALTLCILFAGSAHAYVSEVHSDAVLAVNGSVEEYVRLVLNELELRNNLTYTITRRPYDITSERVYSYANGTLTLFDSFPAGQSNVSFTILYRNVTAISPDGVYTYSASFRPPPGIALRVSLRLPPGHVLADVEPAVSPKPQAVTTDGRSLVLSWVARGDLNIIVISDAHPSLELAEESTSLRTAQTASWLAGFVVFVLLISFVVLLVLRKRWRAPLDVLSEDEQVIVKLIRSGVRVQKEIGTRATFTKSKMSKLVRKLEEKDVLVKTPHFKTNHLALKGRWR
jgi:uncharacterized membrane protein